MIIDTHCHLNDEKLFDKVEDIIKDALNKGIDKIIVPGFDIDSSIKAIELSNKYKGIVYAQVGIHPENCKDLNISELSKIEELLKDSSVVAIGEIGLDYYWDKSYIDKQKLFFIEQIKLADKYNLPISIHCRDAINDTLEILKEHKEYLNNYGIMHCYSGSKELVKSFIDLGMYISFGGTLTFKNSRVVKEVIQVTPLDRLLFETDSPYLSPEPVRGTINIPSNTLHVLKYASNLLNIDINELAEIESNNAKRVFKI